MFASKDSPGCVLVAEQKPSYWGPWISVKDISPENGKRVLVVGNCIIDRVIDYQTATYHQDDSCNPGEPWWDVDGDHCDCCGGPKICEDYEITHWMPLPPLPEIK